MAASCTIVIPVYKLFEALSPSEKASFSQSLEVLNRYSIQLVCPQSLDTGGYAQVAAASGCDFRIQRFANAFFGSINSYNKMLWSKSFYERFAEYKYLLICQLDVWIFKDELEHWVSKNYDYIGAPVFEGFEKNKDYRYSLFLNGGLSLRNIASSLKIIKRVTPLKYLHRLLVLSTFKKIKSVAGFIRITGLQKLLNIKNTEYLRPLLGGMGLDNEDLKWCWAAETFTDFTKPVPEIAMEFAFEFHPSFLYERTGHKLPFGAHAWEKYERSFWRQFIVF